jgi:hypothetical protein
MLNVFLGQSRDFRRNAAKNKRINENSYTMHTCFPRFQRGEVKLETTSTLQTMKLN